MYSLRILPIYLTLCLLAPRLTSGLKLAIKPRAPNTAGAHFGKVVHTGDGTIRNIDNERYTADIIINGQNVTVMLDTGSTDLVQPPQGIGKFNQTKLTANLTYGDGTDFVFGHIGVAPLEFGGYTVPAQAFVNAEAAAESEDTDFSLGISGLLGLSFDSPGASVVNDAVKESEGSNATWGQSVLANIFAQNPTSENFIGISLSRTDDLEGTAEGHLVIGEHDEVIDAVNATKLPLVSSGSWSIQLDGILVNNKSVELTSAVKNFPAGKQVALLDSGTTNVLLAPRFINAIYSQIPGASLAANTTIPSLKYSADSNVWVVPCLSAVTVSAVFGGAEYPIHPLDLTDVLNVNAPDGKNYTVCVGAFTSIGDIGGESFDGLWGASFLRNTYTVYDFGDSKSTHDPTNNTAFMQLVSVTNAKAAATDLTNVRKETLKGMPEELHPDALIALYKQADNEAQDAAAKEQATDASDTKDKVKGTEVDDDETSSDVATSSSSSTAASSTPKTGTLTSTLDNDDNATTDASSALNKYGPLIVGLLAANLLVGVVLLVLGVVTCVRRGGRIQQRKSDVASASGGMRVLGLGARQSYEPVGKDEEGYDHSRPYGQ